MLKEKLALRILSLFLFKRLLLCQRITLERNNLHKIEGKIVGGVPVAIDKFPFAVQLFNYGGMCGGTILSSWAVMTAAHCFSFKKNVKEMQVHAGARFSYDTSAQMFQVWYLDVHKDFNKAAPFACDIALVFVTRPFNFTKRVQKAILVDSVAWMKEAQSFTATGWGRTAYGGEMSALGLMQTNLSFISPQKCSKMHPDMKITSDMFCLYGDGERDTCQGDSGGGILWKGLVVGIVSHGVGCAEKNQPGVYSNVRHFRPWIKKKFLEFRAKYCKYPPA